VLVDMRARLRESSRPNRIFEIALELAKSAGLVGRKRVVDSTALYDAVATQDTVTMIRGAIRALLNQVEGSLRNELKAVLRRDDMYETAGKPACDWDDEAARGAIIDALVRDAKALLVALEGRPLSAPLQQAAQLLATVVGQDIEESEGAFRIARRVAPDRVISVVDPESRHGHETAARGFDGYKGHVAIDPDSEIITATAVTAGNAGDAVAAETLLSDVLPAPNASAEAPVSSSEPPASNPVMSPVPEVYGDASYGTADLVEKLEAAKIDSNLKVQPPSARAGKSSQDDFRIDLDAQSVQCPAGRVVRLRVLKDGAGEAQFGAPCAQCPLRSQCTDSKLGRTVFVHPKHRVLDRARRRQRDRLWKARHRATRPNLRSSARSPT
jgi:hypothetical protein